MPEKLLGQLGPIIIALLAAWLVYRVLRKVKNIIRNKFINDFPLVKEELNTFQIKIDHLQAQVDSLEQKISDLYRRS